MNKERHERAPRCCFGRCRIVVSRRGANLADDETCGRTQGVGCPGLDVFPRARVCRERLPSVAALPADGDGDVGADEDPDSGRGREQQRQ